MNWFERAAMGVALRRLEAKVPTGWMGRFGALGAMLGILGAAFTDFSSGDMTVEKFMSYFAGFSLALSNFGIRRKLDMPSKPAADAPVGLPASP